MKARVTLSYIVEVEMPDDFIPQIQKMAKEYDGVEDYPAQEIFERTALIMGLRSQNHDEQMTPTMSQAVRLKTIDEEVEDFAWIK